MAAISSVLVSIAISVAISVAMRVISSLLAPHQQSYGGQLQSAKDGGTQVTVRNPDQPHQIVFGKHRVQGNIVFAHETDNNAVLHLVVVWAGHKIAAFEDLYFNDELVPLDGAGPTGKYSGFVACYDHDGDPDQAADDNLIAHCPDKWTADHRLRGRAYSYLRLNWDRDKFPQGLPNMWRVLKGKEVYDPRSGETAWSDNAALCQAAWLADAKYGRAIAYGGPNGIDLDALTAAANICDEDVPLAGGGAEKRYTANGVLRSDTAFVDNLNKLLSASHGTAAPIGGQWVIDAAAWEEPVLVLAEKDFRAPFTYVNGIGNDEAFNAIKGTFRNPAKLWNKDDFPAILSAAYEIEDGGDGTGLGREFKDTALELTNSPSMAQRIARIDLRQARQPGSFTAPVKLVGLKARAGNTVAIDNSYVGWDAKAYKVNRLRMVLGFAPGAGEGAQPGIVGVDLDLRETAAEIYDWDAQADEVAHDAAPNTNLPDVFNVGPPGTLVAAESLYQTRDGGGVKAKWTLSWAASPDAFVQSGGWYAVRYRAVGAADWTMAAEKTTQLAVDILDIAPGTYEAEVTAFNWLGAKSVPLVLPPTQVAGLSAPPSTPAGLTVNASGGLAIARWTLPAELDVLQGGGIVFRHAALTTGASWADGVSISDPLAANAAAAVLPLKAGTYLAKFVDSTGNYSPQPASFVQGQASVLSFTALASRVEEPAFAGVRTGMTVDDGMLMLDSADSFDDVAEVDALPSFDYPGGVAAAGSYAFSGPIDLGNVQNVRLTASMVAQVQDVFDNFDERAGDVDGWPSWDGTISGGEADARVMVRSTQTDPAGAPAWSEWQRLDSADFRARGFQFRLDAASTDSNCNILISALDVVAEKV